MKRRPAILAIILLAGCEVTQTVAVDVRGLSAEIAVLLSLTQTGRPQRISEPFGLDRGTLTYGRPPDWVLQGDERNWSWWACPEGTSTLSRNDSVVAQDKG